MSNNDKLMRGLVLAERIAAAPSACQPCCRRRVRSLAAHCPWKSTLEAIAELPCPKMAVDLRLLRKKLSGKTVCPTKKFLLDPAFNLNEILKNSLLFLDHLSSPERYCPECLNKHALLMEAFAEEALGLDAEKLAWRQHLLRALPLIYALRELLDGQASTEHLRVAVRKVIDILPRENTTRRSSV